MYLAFILSKVSFKSITWILAFNSANSALCTSDSITDFLNKNTLQKLMSNQAPIMVTEVVTPAAQYDSAGKCFGILKNANIKEEYKIPEKNKNEFNIFFTFKNNNTEVKILFADFTFKNVNDKIELDVKYFLGSGIGEWYKNYIGRLRER